MGDTIDSDTVAETAIDALKLEEKGDLVDPWNVESESDTGVDYDKLIRKHALPISHPNPLNYAQFCCSIVNIKH